MLCTFSLPVTPGLLAPFEEAWALQAKEGRWTGRRGADAKGSGGAGRTVVVHRRLRPHILRWHHPPNNLGEVLFEGGRGRPKDELEVDHFFGQRVGRYRTGDAYAGHVRDEVVQRHSDIIPSDWEAKIEEEDSGGLEVCRATRSTSGLGLEGKFVRNLFRIGWNRFEFEKLELL